jgi:muramoyltetrapeptide carboxypeptidase
VKIPPFLNSGDTIAFSATARSINMEQLGHAKMFMESKGFKVKIDERLFSVNHQFAGSDKARAELLNDLIVDQEVKAIWNVRGGYGSSRMIDDLDIELLKKNPKWLMGFSDFTVVLNHVYQNAQMATLHASMPIFAWEKQGEELKEVDAAFESIYCALIGEFQAIDCSASEMHRVKDFEGEVIGGNLSVLMSLEGTNSEVDWTDKILFLEDLDEYFYHIDRMFLTLKRSGKLKGIKALLMGSFIQMHDHTIPFGYDVKEIVLNHCKSYNFPIIFDVDSGHHLGNKTIPFGVNTKFNSGILNFVAK